MQSQALMQEPDLDMDDVPATLQDSEGHLWGLLGGGPDDLPSRPLKPTRKSSLDQDTVGFTDLPSRRRKSVAKNLFDRVNDDVNGLPARPTKSTVKGLFDKLTGEFDELHARFPKPTPKSLLDQATTGLDGLPLRRPKPSFPSGENSNTKEKNANLCLANVLEVFADISHEHVRELYFARRKKDRAIRRHLEAHEIYDPSADLIEQILDAGDYPKQRDAKRKRAPTASSDEGEDWEVKGNHGNHLYLEAA
jgi:hypothetical protein